MQPKYLAKLVCPLTKKPLEYHADKQELWSKAARLAFPIRDGIPILLENEARELSDLEAKSRARPPSPLSSPRGCRPPACPAKPWPTSTASRWWSALPNAPGKAPPTA